MKKHLFIIPVLLLILLVVFLKFSPKKSSVQKTTEPKLQKIVLMLPYIQTISWSPYYTAVQNGYYKDEGLEVEIQYSTKGNAGPIEQLAGGSADIILSDTESIINANSKGIDVVAVYLAGPTNLYYIVSEKEKNIVKPRDLIGKKIGILGTASGTYTNLLTILNSENIDPKKVEVISAGLAVVPSFLEKKFDAAVVHLNEKFQIENKGVNLNVINAADYSGVSLNQIAVTSQMIKNNPELVKKFLSATEKGLKFAVNNPEKAWEIYLSFNQEAQSSKEADLAYWNAVIEKQKYKETISGYQSLELWQKAQDLLFSAKLTDKKIDVAKVFTNEFIPL